MKLADLVKAGVQGGATDIHIQAGAKPLFRVLGQLVAANVPEMDETGVKSLVHGALGDQLMARTEQQPVVEAMAMVNSVRCRASVFHQRGGLACVIRLLTAQDLGFEALHLPEGLKVAVQAQSGLVLVTGGGGAGKSTTLAALVHLINSTMAKKIVTIEDLVEYEHPSIKGLVAQIQLGRDADNLEAALRFAIRQDPDVIVLSELVTFDEVRTALSAAETGKLVVSTMLASDVPLALERIRGLIPIAERDLMLAQLSANFRVICCQRLMRGKDRKTLYPATELLVRAPGAIRAIAEGRFMPLNQLMEAEASMHRFDDTVAAACKAGLVTEREGARVATSPEALEMKMRGFGTKAKG